MDDSTSKKIFYCTLVSIILLILTPLSNLGVVNTFSKILILIILGYALLLNMSQLKNLNIQESNNISPQITSQIKMNIVGSYIFLLFLGLLFYFIIKSFFI
jgi:hypothetical protein